jgi:hypothetical protein
VTGELSNSIAEDTSKQLRFERKTERTNSVNQSPTDAIRRGSAGPVGTMMLLKSRQQLHAPFTQVSIDLSLAVSYLIVNNLRYHEL